MLRPTIKQGNSEGSTSTVGGLPAVTCPGAQAATYTLPFQGHWRDDVPVENRPMVTIGCDAADVTPAPAFPLTITLGLALPITPLVGAPTADDVPIDFQTMNEEVVQADDGYIGLNLPTNVVGGLVGFDHQLWLRYSSVDALGCRTEVFAFLPAGVPADVTLAPLVIYALSGGVAQEFVTDPPPAADQGTPLSAVQNIMATSVCPEPQRALAVAPACGFEVQIVQDDPVPVVLPGPVQVSGVGGVVAVEAAPRPQAETVGGQATVLVGGPPVNVPVPDGWSALLASGSGGPGARVLIRFASGSANVDVALPLGSDGIMQMPFPLTAPEGLTMKGATLHVENNGSVAVYAEFVAFYPPAP